MKKEKRKFEKITIVHFILLIMCISCIAFIFYQQNKALIYHCYNIEVYLEEISENKIIVKSLPYATEDVFSGEYIIEINNALIIRDSKENIADSYSLEPGDILLFDYDGPVKFENKTALSFKNGTILNGKKINAHNFRLSDQKLNLKFWRLE